MSFIPSIDVHFTQLKTASKCLRELTTQLDTLSTDGFTNRIHELKSCWEEEGSDLFIHNLQIIGDELHNEALAMSCVVDEIEKDALIMFDAEMYSRGLAFSRWY